MRNNEPRPEALKFSTAVENSYSGSKGKAESKNYFFFALIWRFNF